MADVFRCEICDLHYSDKALAKQCYAWCSKHSSCNLKIARQSIEALRSRK